MRGHIDIKWKGCELIGYWTHFVTMNFDLSHDWPFPWPWLWIFKVGFWNIHIWEIGGLMDMEGNECCRMLDPLWPSTLTSPMTLTLDVWISSSNFKIDVFQEWMVFFIWNERDITLTLPTTLTFRFSRWNFENNRISRITSDMAKYFFLYMFHQAVVSIPRWR